MSLEERKRTPMALVDTREAAKLLGLEEPTLRGWRIIGKGPEYIRMSPRRILYDTEILRQYREDRRVIPVRAGSEATIAALQS